MNEMTKSYAINRIAELEQEKAELKAEIEKLKGVDGNVHPDSAYYKIARLEQENAELKAKVEKLDKMTGIFSARLCEKYRQTLQEIKKIAEQMLNKNEFVYMSYENVRQIIRLIDKAEVEE